MSTSAFKALRRGQEHREKAGPFVLRRHECHFPRSHDACPTCSKLATCKLLTEHSRAEMMELPKMRHARDLLMDAKAGDAS
jgi:hypothetical protein